MSDFKGRVRKVTSKQNSDDKTETIVDVSNDDNNEVNCVKVVYPPDLDPTENPVECNCTDSQNGIRIFSNDSLYLNSTAPGKTVTLSITMVDVNDNTLGTTADVTVTIEGYNS